MEVSQESGSVLEIVFIQRSRSERFVFVEGRR